MKQNKIILSTALSCNIYTIYICTLGIGRNVGLFESRRSSEGFARSFLLGIKGEVDDFVGRGS